MMEHTQTLTAFQASHAATLLSLPNEVLLAVIAHVPFSNGENLVALQLVNRQLFDLLTDRCSLSELLRLIAKIQYPYCLAFRLAKDNPSFGELDGMDAETTIVNRVLSWMENLYPVVENHSNPHNEDHLLHIGLHLFFTISRLGLDVASEYESTLFLTKLGSPATSLMRLTSTRIARCLHELAKLPGRKLQRDMLSSPVIFSDIETMLVRGGLHDINMHISSEATGCTEIKSWEYIDMLLESERSRRRHTPNFSTALIAFEAAKGEQGGQSSPALQRAGRADPSWGNLINDILVLDCCQRAGPVVDFGAIYSSYLGIEYDTVEPIQIRTQIQGWYVTAPAQLQGRLPDFVTADWYDWVAERFPPILEAALERLSQRTSGMRLLQAVGTGFKDAVAARDAMIPNAKTVYRKLRPHCTLLCMREAELHDNEM